MSKALATRTVLDAVEAPTFTVKMARDGFGDLDAAVSAVVAEKSAADRVAGHVMWNAALLAFNVLESNRGDYIGAEKSWKDQGAFVEALGFSKSYGTKLRRLGRAAVVHGVKRGSGLWTFLASNVGNAAVGKAVALEDSTEAVAALEKMAAEMREHGKITAGARTPGGETDQTEDESTRETAQPEKREATLDDVLRTLSEMVKTVDNETWAATESRLQDIITREVTIRTKNAGK